MSAIALAVGLAGVAVSAVIQSNAANKQGQIADSALGLAENTAANQQAYNDQLMQLLQNPSSFLTNPLFTSTLDVGLKGVNRSMAAQGYLGSGNQQTALEQYGQSFASSQLLSQEQLLSSDAGIQSASSPASSLSTASGASSASSNQWGGLLASLGFSASNAIASHPSTTNTNSGLDGASSGGW